MRPIALVLLATLAACGGDDAQTCEWRGMTYARGAIFPAGDGCNQCSCTELGVECTLIACVDAGATSCLPSGTCCGASGPCPQ